MDKESIRVGCHNRLSPTRLCAVLGPPLSAVGRAAAASGSLIVATTQVAPLKVSFVVRRLRGDVNIGLNSISSQIYDVAILSFDDHGKIFQKGQIFLHSWMLVMDMREPNDSDCWSCHFTR